MLDVLLNRDGNLNPSNEVIGDIVMDSGKCSQFVFNDSMHYGSY